MTSTRKRESVHRYKNQLKPHKSKIADSLRKSRRQKKKSILKIVADWRSRHPVLLFLIGFAILMGLFYAFALFTPFYEQHFPYYIGLNAKLSGYILEFLGQNITVRGAYISSPAFSITVKQGCDAIEPTVLFICAVLAFPASFLSKIPGIIVGTLFLAFLNLIRIVTLFLTGVYFPSAFQFMHVEAWQGLFIFLAILSWVLWLLWTGKKQVSA